MMHGDDAHSHRFEGESISYHEDHASNNFGESLTSYIHVHEDAEVHHHWPPPQVDGSAPVHTKNKLDESVSSLDCSDDTRISSLRNLNIDEMSASFRSPVCVLSDLESLGGESKREEHTGQEGEQPIDRRSDNPGRR